MYHHVSTTIQPGPYARALTLDPAEFAHQLQWLRTRSCEAVSVNTIVNDVEADAVRGCEVALTFDDGYSDGYEVARPLLLESGDTATFYVSSGLVNAAGHLTVAQLRGLAGDGFQIGAHTVRHADLTTLSAAAARTEIVESRHALARWSAGDVTSFAYPAGQTNAGVESAVRAAGFRNALTTLPGMLSAPIVRAHRFALPRYRIERDSGTGLFERLLARAATAGRSAAELRSIARRRVEGNDPQLAERIGAALLNASFPEQLLKVRVLRTADATVVGLMLSGVKLHAGVDRKTFAADVGGMIDRAFDARPDVSEVDAWAVVPLEVQPATIVSGDYAAPTNRTVFSAAVTRRAREAALTRPQMLGTVYWGGDFLLKASAQ
jgi:peptidoglycan/xylan/chitin deacetylase (PgdA/CDA1 family)